MKTVGLGKRQGFAHKAGQPLTQGVEPALDRVGFAAIFADRLMTVSGKCHFTGDNGSSESLVHHGGCNTPYGAEIASELKMAIRSHLKS